MSAELYLIVSGIVLSLTAIIACIISSTELKKSYYKMLNLDIGIEDMMDIERAIKDFLKSNNLNPTNANIDEIGAKLKVYRGGISDSITDRAYLNLPDSTGNMYVTFKRGLSKKEMNFDFAHECAHILNHDGAPSTRPNAKNKPKMEQIADYTAAALLMPIDDIYIRLRNENYDGLSRNKKWKFVKNLSKQYNLNEIIIMRRINEIYTLQKSR